ncbi:hypothetical protein D3C73_1653790 [compost metagenome]
MNGFLYGFIIILHSITNTAKAQVIQGLQMLPCGIIRMPFKAKLMLLGNLCLRENTFNQLS